MCSTLYWVLFLVAIFATMFVIVPRQAVLKLSYVGFWVGFVQAVFWLWLGQSYLQLFRINGDPTLMGIPVITSLCWIPAAILFAYYYKTTDTNAKKIFLLLFFAVGAIISQYILERANMWESLNWSLLYTFILALAAHTIITAFLVLTRRKLQQ